MGNNAKVPNVLHDQKILIFLIYLLTNLLSNRVQRYSKFPNLIHQLQQGNPEWYFFLIHSNAKHYNYHRRGLKPPDREKIALGISY